MSRPITKEVLMRKLWIFLVVKLKALGLQIEITLRLHR